MSANATSLSLSSATSTRVSASTPALSPGTNWGHFALVGLGTIIAAVLANTLFYYVGGALVAYDPEFVILATPGGTVFMTFVPAVVAVLLYAALLRFTRRATRVFSIVAAVVLVAGFAIIMESAKSNASADREIIWPLRLYPVNTMSQTETQRLVASSQSADYKGVDSYLLIVRRREQSMGMTKAPALLEFRSGRPTIEIPAIWGTASDTRGMTAHPKGLPNEDTPTKTQQ